MARRTVAALDTAAPPAGRVNKPAASAPWPPNPENSPTVTSTPAPVPVQDAREDLQAISGENLKATRLQTGLKQSDMAGLTGLSQQRLSLIESGKQNLTLRTMMRLAHVVNQNVSAMLLQAKPPR